MDLGQVPEDLLAGSEKEEAEKRQRFLDAKETETQKWVCIVGSGISGVEAAKIFSAGGETVLILEQREFSGG